MKKDIMYVSVSVCKDMEYISKRTCVSCQGHCKDGSPCNKSTGRCDNGCQNHWMGEFCKGKHICSFNFLILRTYSKVTLTIKFIKTIFSVVSFFII